MFCSYQVKIGVSHRTTNSVQSYGSWKLPVAPCFAPEVNGGADGDVEHAGGLTGEEDLKNYYVRESVGIATGFLIAGLHQAGLVTLTHTPAPMNFLNELCGRPKQEKPYLLLVTGYPAEGATVPDHALIKKPLDSIASWI